MTRTKRFMICCMRWMRFDDFREREGIWHWLIVVLAFSFLLLESVSSSPNKCTWIIFIHPVLKAPSVSKIYDMLHTLDEIWQLLGKRRNLAFVHCSTCLQFLVTRKYFRVLPANAYRLFSPILFWRAPCMSVYFCDVSPSEGLHLYAYCKSYCPFVLTSPWLLNLKIEFFALEDSLRLCLRSS